MSRRVTVALTILSAVLLTAVAYAGAAYSFQCLNKDCAFKTDVNFGGGFVIEQMTGYCVDCKEFVYLRWARKGKEPVRKGLNPDPPAPVAHIWNPSTGEILSLYACPKCTKPFLPIKDVKDLTHCPRCAKDTIKLTGEGFYD